MILNIQPRSGTPIYLQIQEQIKHAITLGIFKPGDPLPTIREMALQAKVNPNTVAKAIRELEREGLLLTQVGKGSFVNDKAPELTRQDNEHKAGELATGYGRDMRWLGFDRDSSAEKVIETWEEES